MATTSSNVALSNFRMTAINGCNITVTSSSDDLKSLHDDEAVNDELSASVHLGKRTDGRDQEQRIFSTADVTNGEINGKRRRVQHNYRRLSSSGYLDDYDGKERFSGELGSPPSGNSSSPSPRVKPVDTNSPRGGSSVRPVGGSRSHKHRCETDANSRGM
jgi:hypothetical protein